MTGPPQIAEDENGGWTFHPKLRCIHPKLKFHGELGHLDDGSNSRFVFMPTVLSMVQQKTV